MQSGGGGRGDLPHLKDDRAGNLVGKWAQAFIGAGKDC